MSAPHNRRPGFTALGMAGILFYAIHGATYVMRRQAENLLWFCHLGALVAAVGVLFRQPSLTAVGTLWLVVGLPMWIYDLARGGEFIPTSVLTHVGGLAIGAIGIRALGVPKGLWWKSLIGLAVVHVATKLLTPPDANVNLVFRVDPGAEPYFHSHPLYILSIAALYTVVAVLFQVALRRLGPAPQQRR